MTDEKDYYKTLGVKKDASQDEIKKAYKELAKKYHPDMNKESSSEENFKKINNAYSVLGDSEKRKQYDTFGEAAFNGTGGASSQGYSGSGGFSGFGFDFSDIFSNFMDEDSDSDYSEDSFFSSFGGRGGGTFRRKQSSRRNLNLKYNLEIDFLTAARGGSEDIIINHDELCDACEGTGSKHKKKETCERCKGRGKTADTRRTPFGIFSIEQICSKCGGSGEIIKDPCSSCSGSGFTKKKKTITINIPAGINNQDILRVVGQGNFDKNSKGDLFIQISVKPHDFFKREGSSLYCEFPVTYTDLMLGSEIKIKGIQDIINLKVPAHTDSGTIFKIRGKGVADVNHGGVHGDLYVKVNVEIPKTISKEYKDTLIKLAELEKKTVKKGIFDKFKEFLSGE
ncbi:MAG: molecular chaperone DnaJ [archaeon]